MLLFLKSEPAQYFNGQPEVICNMFLNDRQRFNNVSHVDFTSVFSEESESVTFRKMQEPDDKQYSFDNDKPHQTEQFTSSWQHGHFEIFFLTIYIAPITFTYSVHRVVLIIYLSTLYSIKSHFECRQLLKCTIFVECCSIARRLNGTFRLKNHVVCLNGRIQ